MKAYQIAFILLVLLAACSKEPEPEPPAGPWWGETTALENGMNWNGSPFAIFDKKDSSRMSIQIDSLKYGYFRCKNLYFSKVPVYPGTYIIDRSVDTLIGSKYFYLDHDVLYGVYIVLESDTTNAITISSYDSVSREIKGSFNVTFVPEHLPYPGAPDTIRFRNGQFHTKIIK